MQNRNAIKVFTLLFAIVCLYQLSFTWVADGVQDDAVEYANTYIESNEETLIAEFQTVSNDSLLDSVIVNDYLKEEFAKREKYYLYELNQNFRINH